MSTASVIELIVGLFGIISAAGGFAAWQTANSIRHNLNATIASIKQDAIITRRRIKLLELFAANNGFQRESTLVGEDTDL